MNIAIIGASGSAGSRIVSEALARGHQVTGIARHADKIASRDDLRVAAGDVAQPGALAELLAGHDVVVSAVRFQGFDLEDLLEALRRAHVPRLVMVGGAGSLRTASGGLWLDAPPFPEEVKGEARAGAEKLKALRAQRDIDWTFLSPSALFEPGERTGRYRVGSEELLTDANGESRISQEDYAIALLDEVESPRHRRERFTVGY
ncbi:NAD(P)-dependent oxidoreductase [Variovorax sp. JS1663]|uniref:NAD(P)-dependent oxidoreductase n=1 Tax=Variovorax sp. JS1663 TaxID=1851577 RepID=UPI000B342333|nr:NAD(P)-dependent oxidoreductase [Variovorax sp. JS1663]OUM02014.1 3-beta hydroxysteroid dehydrogenase [Variovorax sp. JS1663]